ncbi:hypothetical protein, partial [uncultured Shewanella sp.]|uniref:hypothetical protein n=1 Tax=uncultured Shewanella sp. TaxID=173975 RepID=UPI002613B01A
TWLTSQSVFIVYEPEKWGSLSHGYIIDDTSDTDCYYNVVSIIAAYKGYLTPNDCPNYRR